MWSNLLKTPTVATAALNRAWDDDDDDIDEDLDGGTEEEEERSVEDVALDDNDNVDRYHSPEQQQRSSEDHDAQHERMSQEEEPPAAAMAAPPVPTAGLFMGRLTRFIEHVTQADNDGDGDDEEDEGVAGTEEYDESGDFDAQEQDRTDPSRLGDQPGWHNPSLEEFDAINDQYNTNITSGDGWQQEEEDLDFSEHYGDAVQSPSPPHPPPPPEEEGPAPSSPPTTAVRRIVLVDHTPPVTPQRPTHLASAASSSGHPYVTSHSVGSLSHVAHRGVSDDHSSQLLRNDDEYDDVYDNEDELAYGPVVDHTPVKSNTAASASSGRPSSRQNSLAVQVDATVNDYDTYDDEGYDDNNEEEGWGDDDVDLDIDLPPLDADGPPSDNYRGSLLLPESTAAVVVDHTPSDVETAASSSVGGGGGGRRPRPASASVRVLLPYSSDDEGLGASTVGGDAVIDDDDDGSGAMALRNPLDGARFGPVVDHTPLGATDSVRCAVAAKSGASSVAVQAPVGLEQDYRDDDAMDETLCGGDNSTTAADDYYGDVASSAVGDDEAATGSAWEQDDADLDQLNEDDANDKVHLYGSSGMEVSGGAPHATFVMQAAHPVALEGENTSPLVDHTPDDDAVGGASSAAEEGGRPNARGVTGDPVDPSVVVLVAPEDISRDTGNGIDEDVYDDENELDYGPVVDVTPTTPSGGGGGAGTPSVVSGANSMAVQAGQLYEEFQEDDAMDYTAFGGDADKEDGWDQDDDDIKLDDDADEDMALSKGPLERSEEKLNGVAMVDHTPSEMGSPTVKVNDPSVDVLNSASTKSDDSAGGNEFGLVVDQTPSTPGPSGVVRSDSVVVQAQDLDTVDESYADKAEDEEEDDGGDTVDAEMPMNFRSSEAPLVDFIPNRPESRYGDASTMVAADLSEVLSEVDDMAQEEGNFGPVVDVTPPTRAVAAAAGSPSAAESVAANSTAVFAPPSVAADDLDGDEETVTRGDQSAWDHQEEAPNPQSGNDDPVERVNEQLVDFLPPPAELEVTDHESSLEGREPSSEVTVGGAQSLLQPLDPKEDDFGPVVDLTPVPRPLAIPHSGHSLASTATQVTASECRALEKEDITEGAAEDVDHMKGNVVVDKLPQTQVRFPIDSTGSVLGSQLAEDEEEDDSKFGPVVDHLPTPRASLAPSRGGSTVDALATVSEVDSVDDDGGDGWDDDIDVSESGISDRSAVQKAVATRLAFRRSSANDPERSVSVRFEIALEDGRDEGRSSESLNHTQYFDPEIGTGHSAEDAEFFDPSSVGQSSWVGDIASPGSPELDAEMSTKAFAEADTPPSTPYRRPEIPTTQPEARLLQEHQEVSECHSCMNDHTIQCPCIQRLLQINHDSNALIGTLRTAEGDTVLVDFSKLLQDEMAKRLLVEKESEALRSAIDFKNINESLSAAKDLELESLTDVLKKENEMLKSVVSQVQAENAVLQEERAEIKDELDTSRQSLSGAEKKKDSWSARESALEVQIFQLKEALELATTQIVSDTSVADMVTTLQKDLASKSGECEELNSQIMRLQLRLEDSESQRRRLERVSDQQTGELRQLESDHARKIHALSRQLEESQKFLEGKQESDSKTTASLSAEVWRLSEAKEELLKSLSDLRRQHEEEIQYQFAAIDRKTAEINALEASVKNFEMEKSKMLADNCHQRSLAQQSEALAAELLSVAEERDFLVKSLAESNQSVLSLQKLVDEHGMQHDAVESRRDAELATLKNEIKNAANELHEKKLELQGAWDTISRKDSEQEETKRALEEVQVLNRSLQTELDAARTSYADELKKADSAIHEVAALQSQVSHLSSKLEQAEAERRKSMSHLAALGRTLERAEQNASEQSARSLELASLLDHATKELSFTKTERDSLKGQCDEWRQRCNDIEAKHSVSIEEANRLRQETNHLCREKQEFLAKNQELEQQLKDRSLSSQSLQSERDHLTVRCRELESQLVFTREQAQVEVQTLSEKHQGTISNLQTQLRHLEGQLVDQRHFVENLELQLAEQRHIIEGVASERNALRQKCRDLEDTSKELTNETSRRLEQLSRSFDDRETALKNEHARLARSLRESTTPNDQFVSLQGEVLRLTKEHGLLVEENEELLVQLGLLKQQLDATEDQVRFLQEEVVARDELIGRVDELSEENATLSREIENLEAELSGSMLENPCLEVEPLQDRENPNAREPRSQLKQKLLEAQEKVSHLEETCEMLKGKSESLLQENQALEASVPTSLQQQVLILESSCAAKTSELQERVNELTVMKRQLDESQQKQRAAENALSNKNARISELESLCEESADHLSFARDQLAAAEATLHAEEKLASFEAAIKDLETNEKQATDVILDYEQRMEELERELNQKVLLVSRLEGSISELQFQLDAGQSMASLQLSRELQTVHEDLESDVELNTVKEELSTVSEALHSTRVRLAEKEEEIDRLKAELVQTQAKPTLLEDDLSQSQGKSSDHDLDQLRSHVVSLAVALERSETKRAEAISRLMTERENNARSLKRLAESVKRYYHKVGAGDL